MSQNRRSEDETSKEGKADDTIASSMQADAARRSRNQPE